MLLFRGRFSFRTLRDDFITGVGELCTALVIVFAHVLDPFAMKSVVRLELVCLDDSQGRIDDPLHEANVLEGEIAHSNVHHVD